MQESNIQQVHWINNTLPSRLKHLLKLTMRDLPGLQQQKSRFRTSNAVEVDLSSVAGAVFPCMDLETKKLWMRRSLWKQNNMKYGLLQSKLLNMSKSFPWSTHNV